MVTVTLDPGNKIPIKNLYAFLSVDENGNEGIVAVMGVSAHMPLVTGTESLLPKMEAMAKQAMAAIPGSKKRIHLVRFTARETIRVVA